jgi:hypothetical protein
MYVKPDTAYSWSGFTVFRPCNRVYKEVIPRRVCYMVSDDIRRKIRKLLALSQSPFSAEAESAMRKARELMAEYDIVEGTVDCTAERDAVKPKKAWEQALTSTCYRRCNCVVVNMPNGTYNFYGKEANLFLAKELSEYLIASIRRYAWQLALNKKEEREICESACATIADRMRTAPGWAVDQSEAEKSMALCKSELGNLTNSRGWAMSRGSDIGCSVGNMINLNKQTGGRTTLQLR